MNKPQLTAEMKKRLLDLLPLGLDDWLVEDIKHFLATALEEERVKVLSEVEKMKKTDKFPQSLTTYDGKTKYFYRLSDGDLHYNQAIQDVLAKLNQLKGSR